MSSVPMLETLGQKILLIKPNIVAITQGHTRKIKDLSDLQHHTGQSL